MPNYSKDGPFDDPVLRCCECSKLVYKTTIREHGMCGGCGNRRVRNLSVLSPEEMAEMKEKGIDPAFLALFEEAEDGD